jgi:hypothetical protein
MYSGYTLLGRPSTVNPTTINAIALFRTLVLSGEGKRAISLSGKVHRRLLRHGVNVARPIGDYLTIGEIYTMDRYCEKWYDVLVKTDNHWHP